MRDMDAHLEQITEDNHKAAVRRVERENERRRNMVAECMKSEHRGLQRKRKAVYRSSFHVAALITALLLLLGLSEIGEGSPIVGLVICTVAAAFGLFACILDCLGH